MSYSRKVSVNICLSVILAEVRWDEGDAPLIEAVVLCCTLRRDKVQGKQQLTAGGIQVDRQSHLANWWVQAVPSEGESMGHCNVSEWAYNMVSGVKILS